MRKKMIMDVAKLDIDEQATDEMLTPLMFGT